VIGVDVCTLMDGASWSVLRGLVRVLMTGGGERSLGDIGQRGRSLGSTGKAIFCGMGALIVVSDTVGRS
jgi:hypothetical protein